MITLSIRQPWAWLILRPDMAGDRRQAWLASPQRKDIENRDWAAGYRGPLLVHAAKGCTRDEYDACWHTAISNGVGPGCMPELEALQRGGIVGLVRMIGCVAESDSPWFVGRHGFVLADPQPLPFTAWTGKLGFFDVPRHAVAGLAELEAAPAAPSRAVPVFPF